MNKNKKILLHLSLISQIGPSVVLKIVKFFFDDFYEQKNSQIKNLDFDFSQIYRYKSQDFIKKFGLTKSISDILVKGLCDKKDLEKELNLIEKYNIDILTFLDSEYSHALKQIHSPPIVLYCKGEKLEAYEKNIAVIGARKANFYAENVVNDIVPQLVQNGYAIISGGALGVDSMAHKAALKSGGSTIVVFGSGLMNPYPSSNKDLFRQIVKNGGTLISPFSLFLPPAKGNFPARNRVIAGLSCGCVVVQAAKKSGALITAKFALDEGRQVFAVPGSVLEELSFGCHELIKQGAKLVSSVDDILEEFGQSNCCEASIEKEDKKIKSSDSQEDLILYNLSCACSLDEIAIKTKIKFDKLQEKLFDMQIEGKIKQNFAGLWEKNEK
ncbi:DNA-processing protein DprA [Candidatus Babeliales bacterium]|nr:DNA-processing protein DprA [Candidatus Babeliales bacterium]